MPSAQVRVKKRQQIALLPQPVEYTRKTFCGWLHRWYILVKLLGKVGVGERVVPGWTPPRAEGICGEAAHPGQVLSITRAGEANRWFRLWHRAQPTGVTCLGTRGAMCSFAPL